MSSIDLQKSPKIDLQSDTTLYGRGDMHLSAVLEEGDVVAYRTGSWEVDGVTVGDEPTRVEFCIVDTLQIVWTHNCEHGYVRGIAVDITHGDGCVVSQRVCGDSSKFFVEFGPEQLVARLPVEWEGGECGEKGYLLVSLPKACL